MIPAWIGSGLYPFTTGGPFNSALQDRNGSAATLSGNAAAGLTRVAVNSVIALLVPSYLTHILPVATYGAWVLILQLAAYVSFLDFGVQSAVAKFVAEYNAKGDDAGAGRYASAGLGIMAGAGLLGLSISLLLAWQVPRLFHNMPTSLYQDVRISVMFVGASLSFGLVCSVFSAVFLGLQRYLLPAAVSIVNRVAYTVVVLATATHHCGLAVMGCAVAAVNVATSLSQIILCRKLLAQIRVSFIDIQGRIMKQMTSYCGILVVWSAAMLCISGLDVMIVGHFDFRNTGYYYIATAPNSFLLMILTAVMGPLLPAASAWSVRRGPVEMGRLLSRTTRYATICLLLLGLTLFLYGPFIFRLWVGSDYAQHSYPLFCILIVANILRNLTLPYSTIVVALGRQRAVTLSAICEACVNLACSLYFVRILGARGVAYGTFLGALVGVGVHLTVSMHYTAASITIPRRQFIVGSILRPSLIATPTLFFFVWSISGNARLDLWWSVVTSIATLFLAFSFGLNLEERQQVSRMFFQRWAFSDRNI